ncbi:YihY/virulence factor BrkB family protein [Luedemannella helvata]|uniref:YihY/virulence factor BrkB family protein n=1 Tax=Luedemannella helvata TaxID=349315 RepID=A0ABP4WVV1_9ACTN
MPDTQDSAGLPLRARQRALARLLDRGPRRPRELSARSWWHAFRRTILEFWNDDLTDRAAALTYYGIQSIFPGMLVLVSLLGLLGGGTTQEVLDNIEDMTPGPLREFLTTGIAGIRRDQGVAGVLAIVGVIVAFWSASSYIAAFMRAANAIYDVPEGRPLWKTLPIRILVTALTGLLLAASALTVIFTGRLAHWTGDLLGISPGTVELFDVIKWPVLVVAVALLFDLLYWAAPNARQGGWRWITPGTVLAVLVFVAVSAGFGFYVGQFGNYNKTYGTVGAVIVFLIWLWLSNVALLLGAEFDAELHRRRAIEAGLPAEAEPYVLLRQAPGPADEKAAAAEKAKREAAQTPTAATEAVAERDD